MPPAAILARAARQRWRACTTTSAIPHANSPNVRRASVARPCTPLHQSSASAPHRKGAPTSRHYVIGQADPCPAPIRPTIRQLRGAGPVWIFYSGGDKQDREVDQLGLGEPAVPPRHVVYLRLRQRPELQRHSLRPTGGRCRPRPVLKRRRQDGPRDRRRHSDTQDSGRTPNIRRRRARPTRKTSTTPKPSGRPPSSLARLSLSTTSSAEGRRRFCHPAVRSHDS
jgi:hypothetical protein